MKDNLKLSGRFAVSAAVGRVNRDVAGLADNSQVALHAVVADAPGHDVVDVQAQSVQSSCGTSLTDTTSSTQGSPALSIPLWPVGTVRGCSHAPRDTRTGPAALDVLLDANAAIRAVPPRHFVFTTAGVAPRRGALCHGGAALRTGPARLPLTLAAQRVRTGPAPASLRMARRRATGFTQPGTTAPLLGCTGRAALGAPLNCYAAIGADLGRHGLPSNLTRMAARRISGDRARAISAAEKCHNANMIAGWRCR